MGACPDGTERLHMATKARMMALAAVVFCGAWPALAGSAPVAGGDYFIQDNFSRAVRFEVAGYSGTSALTDFPVLVRLSPSRIPGFSYGDFYLRNGRDMVFLDAAGNLVPHEIDTWNTEGESLVWVKLPSMTNGTVFSMCYRSPMTDVLVDPGTPWTKYTGVWHLGETEDGDTDLADSTPNGLTGWAHARSLAAPNGKIGGARRVAQSTGSSGSHGQIVVADTAAHALDVGTSFSFSLWMNPQAAADYVYIATRKDTDYKAAWGVQASDHTSYRTLRMWSDEVGKNKPNIAQYFTTDRLPADASGLDTWYHIAVTYAGTTATIYIDGQSVGSIALHGLPSVDPDFDNIVFGGCGTGYGAFNGYMDEIRYAPSTLSATWIAADYASQSDTNFISSSAVHFGAESVVPVVEWRQGEELPESIIDTSFAYVQFAGKVRFCGTGASSTEIQYRLWADGNPAPPIDEWQTLATGLADGDSFSVPVPGLAMDTPHHFEIRAVNDNPGGSMANTELRGMFRTYGNGEPGVGGDIYRLKNRYIHVFSSTEEESFITPYYANEVQILVVGGGGAGGYRVGGGGGGGAVRYEASYAVGSNTSYRVTVGRGGTPSASASQRGGNGADSSFALGGTTLISCAGGGAGGNYNATASSAIAKGATGACGGGSYGHEVSGGSGTVGHDGGVGNSNTDRWAAGGGGGVVSKGGTATPDNPSFGGVGGRGFACRITGELSYYGAGGGGGVQYRYNDNTQNYAGAGTGGSGTGGSGANPVTKAPAASGMPNTGSGGGGGSVDVDNATANYVGGAGADGIVVIAYEIRGDRELEATPEISLTAVSYQPTNWLATVDYRLGWAGVGEDLNTVYVLYSTSIEDAVAGVGTRVPVGSDVVGMGTGDFEVPLTATNYYVRLIAETPGGLSVMSKEILMFNVPGLNEDQAVWREAASGELADGHAEIVYRFHWDREHKDTVRLFLLWSEDEFALQGDGSGAFIFEYGQGYVLDGVQQGTLTFFDPRLERGKMYHTRLKCVDEVGGRIVHSPEVLPFSIPDVLARLTLGPFDGTGGAVSGVTTTGDAYPIHSEVTVSATPASGYYLAGWKMASSAAGLETAGFAPNSIGRTRYALILDEDMVIVPVFKELETMILRGVQRYPWNNLVDIDYYIKQDATNARLVFTVTDEISGRTVTMRSFRDNTDVSQPIKVGGTPALRQPGWHRITWDANADGVAVFSRNVTYTLQVCQGVDR